MEISKEDYFFYEWLILGKGMSKEEFENLTNLELIKLKKEYKEFESSLR